MNLQRPNANDATRSVNRSKSIVPSSGLCSRCVDGCTGNCEVFKATFRSRELIYPGPFGDITAGGDKDYPVDYSHLNIQGYALGANGMPDNVTGDSDSAIFPSVNTETEYGWDKKVKMRIPVFTGALGSTEIARKNWEHFAVGAALSGITLVCGEMFVASIRSLNWIRMARLFPHRIWTDESKSIDVTTADMAKSWYR
jgi:glutamate synthase domain-containing protein 2